MVMDGTRSSSTDGVSDAIRLKNCFNKCESQRWCARLASRGKSNIAKGMFPVQIRVLCWGAAFSNNMQLKNKRSGNLSFMTTVKSPIKIVTWIYQNWYMDFCKLLHGFVEVVPGIPRPRQPKPSWSLTKNSELIEASALIAVYWVKVLNALDPLCLYQCFKSDFWNIWRLGYRERGADVGDAFACKDALVTDCRRRKDG